MTTESKLPNTSHDTSNSSMQSLIQHAMPQDLEKIQESINASFQQSEAAIAQSLKDTYAIISNATAHINSATAHIDSNITHDNQNNNEQPTNTLLTTQSQNSQDTVQKYSEKKTNTISTPTLDDPHQETSNSALQHTAQVDNNYIEPAFSQELNLMQQQMEASKNAVQSAINAASIHLKQGMTAIDQNVTKAVSSQTSPPAEAPQENAENNSE